MNLPFFSFENPGPAMQHPALMLAFGTAALLLFVSTGKKAKNVYSLSNADTALCHKSKKLLQEASMTVNTLLDMLDKVKKTGRNKWTARCPAHADKTPSLSIKELDDGRVLIICFAGCGAAEVLDALGLDFNALNSPSDGTCLPRVRKPWNAMDVLHGLAFEALYAWNCAKAVSAGEILNETEMERLLLSVTRLQAALEVARG